AGGICGSISAHSASVRSLAYRCPSRSYFGRVISVHILCLDDCLSQTSCHSRLKSLNPFSVSLLDRGQCDRKLARPSRCADDSDAATPRPGAATNPIRRGTRDSETAHREREGTPRVNPAHPTTRVHGQRLGRLPVHPDL